MFRKNNNTDNQPQTPKKISPSVISSDVNLLGNIISEGLIDFDGNINGNITCNTLVLRANAKVNGEVRADTVHIAGRINGTIRARVVVLQKSAFVEGVILHEQITIEDGATIDGKLKKTNKASTSAANDDGNMLQLDDLSADSSARLLEHIRLISNN